MKRKPYGSRRYVHIMWDGVYDSHRDPECKKELTLDEMCSIMNDVDNQIKVWQDKYANVKKELEVTKKQLEACRRK